jgi:DNA-binding response OmpR family regulator
MVTATSDYLKPISFLIVDDKAYMRKVVKNVLETLGAKLIEEAHDGSEALAAVRNWPPDIILTEWRLYPMTGFDLLKAIRAERGALRFTPVVMITSETRRERVIQARNTGITEFVAKPFNAKGLLLRIKEVIERPRPYVEASGYFGPDRRRRSEVMGEGEERRGAGGPREPAAAQSKGQRGMTQEQIDRLVAGDNIRER